MSNIDQGFSVDVLSLNDNTLITSGVFDPRVVGYEAPEGSIFAYKAGALSAILLKNGISDTSWADTSEVISGLPTGGLPGEYLVKNSTNNYDFVFTSDVMASSVTVNAKNDTATILPKGTPVYQTGIAGESFTILVRPADAADPLKMPAIGVLNEDLDPAAEGAMLILGKINGVSTLGFNEGDLVYVGAGGGYTNIKPTDPNIPVQFLGIVTKVHPTNGGGVMTGLGSVEMFRHNADGTFAGWSGTQWEPISAGAEELNDLNDVLINNPQNNQTLIFNGVDWINSNTSDTGFGVDIQPTTNLSGNLYYTDINHNLGTTQIVVQLFEVSTNKLIQPDSVIVLDDNNIRVIVSGNSNNLRVNIVANGLAIAASNSGAVNSVNGRAGDVTLTSADVGLNNVTNNPQVVNQGGSPSIQQGLNASKPSAGTDGRLYLSTDTKTIYRDDGVSWNEFLAPAFAQRKYLYTAMSMDSPSSTDFPITALSPLLVDPVQVGVDIRSFSNTTSQGVAFMIDVPVGAQSVVLILQGRSSVTPGVTNQVCFGFYNRFFPNNANITPWTSMLQLTTHTLPTNIFYQRFSQTIPLATLGMVTPGLYQVEIARYNGVANNYNNLWYLVGLSVEFV